MELWQLVTDLAKTKQGPAVALSLHGRKREVAMEVSIDEPNADTGLPTLLAKLEKAFAKEGADQAFEAYERFESLTRGSKSVVQHIVDFESAYSRIQKHKMTLPDSVLACKLLH